MSSAILLAIVAALAIRIAMHFFDTARIRDEVEAKGGRMVSINWNPFGRGWFLSEMSAITTSLTGTVPEPRSPPAVRRACSLESIGLTVQLATNRRGLFLVIIVQSAAMRLMPTGVRAPTAATSQPLLKWFRADGVPRWIGSAPIPECSQPSCNCMACL